MLKETNCPACGAPGLEAHQPDGVVICKFCNSHYTETDDIACPQCEAINGADVLFCHACGEKLKRTCAACHTENWAGADYCSACGRELDVMTNMANRTREGFAERLEQHRQNAPTLKAQQDAQSKKIANALWETERRRTAALEEQRARQRAENNKIVTLMVGAAVFLILLILVGTIVLSLAAKR